MCHLQAAVLCADQGWAQGLFWGLLSRDSTADTVKAGSTIMLAARDALPCREANSSRWARLWRMPCSNVRHHVALPSYLPM